MNCKKIIIGLTMIVGFFGGSLFAQFVGAGEDDPYTDITIYDEGDNEFNPTTGGQVTTTGSTSTVSSGICQNLFGQSYDQIQNNVKEQSGKCCYIGVKDPAQLSGNWSMVPGSENAFFTIPNNNSISLEFCDDAGSTDNTVVTNFCRFENPDITDVTLLPVGYTKGDCSINSCGTGAQYIEKRVSTDQGDVVMCEKCDMDKCNCGVKLNTNVPFIGRCIMYENTNDINANGDGSTTVNPLNAFPVLMGALVKILMSVIMIICFASLIIGGFMMTVPDQYNTGKGIVKKVIWTIVGLGSLGTLLYLINPNFFS